MKLMNEFKNKAVRDLAWVIESPYLMDESTYSWLFFDDQSRIDFYHQFNEHLVDIDECPSELMKMLEQRPSHRLGYYFEDLVCFWLSHLSNVENIVRNKQIKNRDRTLGEFDFLFFDPQKNRHFHWEVAIKFYLSMDNKRAWKKWVGPNANDNLDQKLSKLIHFQSQLAGARESEAFLADMGINNLVSKILLKGYFFYHYDEFCSQIIQSPYQASSTHLRGWWQSIDELKNIKHEQVNWIVLEKFSWFSPLGLNEEVKPFSLDEVIQHFDDLEENFYPVMLMEISENENGLKEVSRGFVVPESFC
ncbi:MAG: DUF1853 family protein [Methylococcales bacterium]|jgi:uncharacterized protein|nr:DUF1853 family protein [Methylococcales bacterium]MBT7408342.1 DUF1853 family protein [Methylococcales bacterium]